jgi:hypothetical protein
MMDEADPIFAALAAREAPPLPDALASRALARARAHLPEPERRAGARAPLSGIALPQFVVPALLASAAAVFAVDACLRIARLFG